MKIFQSLKKIIGIVIPMMLATFFTNGQTVTPSYSDLVTSCTSKDLELVDAKVTGSDGYCNPCSLGNDVTKYLSLAIYNKTGSTRTNFKFWADLEITDPNGVVTTNSISGCKGPVPSNSKTWLDFSDPLKIPCGGKIRLKNIILGWTDASKGPKNDCDNLTLLNISPKCGGLPEIEVRSGMTVSKTVTNSKCNTQTGKIIYGSIDIKVGGGYGGYTYVWSASNGGVIPEGQTYVEDLSGIKKSGTYTVTINDVSNCPIIAVCNVTVATPPILSGVPNQSSCNNGSPTDASIDLSVSPSASYNYTWYTNDGTIPSGQANQQDLTGIKKSGTYSVSVGYDAGCYEATSYAITILQAPVISSSNITPSSCAGTGKPSDGAITIGISGGVPGYNYSWSTTDGEIPSGQSGNQNLTGIKTSGVYAVTVTDSKYCIATSSFVVTILRSPSVSAAAIVNSSCDSGTPTLGSINITAYGGAPVYTYSWTASNGGAVPSGQANSEDLSGIATSGSYNVVVTDVNSCTVGGTYMITVLIPPAAPKVTLVSHPDFCNATGSLKVTNCGSDLEYSYGNSGVWTTNTTVGNISAGEGASYSISVRNQYGCISQLVGICDAPTETAAPTSITNNLTTTESNVAQPTTAVEQQQVTSTNVSNLGSATLDASLSVKAMPNPFNDQVRFTINSIDRGTATLEIYNLYGQKIKTVYNGIVNPGINYFDLRLASAQRTSELIYVFTMGTQKITGKLIQNAQ